MIYQHELLGPLATSSFEIGRASCRPVNIIHGGFFLTMFEILIKEWPGGCDIVMETNPRVHGYISCITIIYK